jgi:hypothetical protein
MEKEGTSTTVETQETTYQEDYKQEVANTKVPIHGTLRVEKTFPLAM